MFNLPAKLIYTEIAMLILGTVSCSRATQIAPHPSQGQALSIAQSPVTLSSPSATPSGSNLQFINSNLQFTTTVEWQSPPSPPGISSTEPFTSLWHFRDSTYFVWPDSSYRIWITQIKNGIVTVVPLDNGSDYTAIPDGHNRFSLGVDKNGYIHVTGDMHHYMSLTDQCNGIPYPVRYQKQTILYWKSNQPQDVSGGFSFAGGLNASTAIPGGGWTSGKFFADNNGELFYTSMVHAYEALNSDGQMAVGLYRYDTTTLTWTALGKPAKVNLDYMSNLFPVLYWELAGSNDGTRKGWFQNYQASFKFDSSNNLHFAVTGNTDSNLAGPNRIIYAVSPDGGTTWKRANGSVIPSLPIRGIDSDPSVGDIVADSGTSKFFTANVGLVVDGTGHPSISVSNIWRTWKNNAWSTDNAQNFSNLPVANYGYNLPNNNLLLNVNGMSKIFLTSSFDDLTYGYDFPGYSGFVNIDESTLRNSGVLYGVGLNKNTNTQTILKTVLASAPLPSGWSCSDIGSPVPTFKGTCSYINGKFVSTNYGVQMGDVADSLVYIYKKMTGDGTIVARVPSVLSAAGNAVAGLMMRETLDPSAKEVGVILTPGTPYKSVQWLYRPTSPGASLNSTSTEVSNPSWLKLVRAGNDFSGYASSDGVTWTLISSFKTNVPMDPTIYVGLAAASFGSLWFMESATFDNVMVP